MDVVETTCLFIESNASSTPAEEMYMKSATHSILVVSPQMLSSVSTARRGRKPTTLG